MNAAEELDDDRAGSRSLGRADTEEGKRQEESETGSGVCLDEEQNRLAGLGCLLDPQRREDTVVDGVVQEQHLRRFDDDRHERQQVHRDEPTDRATKDCADAEHDGAEHEEPDDREDHSEDAGGEVVDQHLEAGLDLAVPDPVHPLGHESSERAHDHGTEEHRDVGADDDTHGRDRRDHTTALAVDHATTSVGDQKRQQVDNHRADEADIREEVPAVTFGQLHHCALPTDESLIAAGADDV